MERLVNVDFRSILAMVMPVSSMAMGDMQFPRVVTAEEKKAGRGSTKIKYSMKISGKMAAGMEMAPTAKPPSRYCQATLIFSMVKFCIKVPSTRAGTNTIFSSRERVRSVSWGIALSGYSR